MSKIRWFFKLVTNTMFSNVLLYRYDTSCIIWMKFWYSQMSLKFQKLFKSFGTNWMRMFWIRNYSFHFRVQIRNFWSFRSKEDTFQTCWAQILSMFWLEIRFFPDILYQIWYFSNVLLKNSILFGCFGSKSDTFSMFWTELR